MDRPRTALIGHTGFVGGNLARQHEFAGPELDAYNAAFKIPEIALDVLGGLVGRDWPRDGRKRRSGVQLAHDPHDGDAGFRVTRHDRAFDGCRATPARQRVWGVSMCIAVLE